MRKEIYKTVLMFAAVSSMLWIATPAIAGLDQGTINSGLKEALSMSTERAIATVGRTDGFYGNPLE